MGFLSVLQHRNFLFLWISQLISRLGDSIHEIALIWAVFHVVGDPTILALTVTASIVPTTIFSFPAGAIVDRWNRKYILIISSIIQGSVVLLIPIIGRGELFIPTIIFVAFIAGLMEAFAGPARSSLIPHLVPDHQLDDANALFEFTKSASRILYILGGLVVVVVGSFSAFYLDAISFLASSAVLLAIPSSLGTPKQSSENKQTILNKDEILKDMYEGISIIRTSRVLQSTIFLSLITTLSMSPLAVVLPFLLEQTSGRGSLKFGILYGAIYFGIMVGAILVEADSNIVPNNRGKVVVVGVIAMGFALLGISILHSISWSFRTAVGILGIFGITFSFVNIPIRTLVQQHVSDDKLGKVFSILTTITLPALPLGAAAAGPLIDYFGVTMVLFGEGLLVIMTGIILLFTPLVQVTDIYKKDSIQQPN